MATDYVTIAMALALAAQALEPEVNALNGGNPSLAALLVLLSLVSLLAVPWLDFASLRLGWFMSGAILCTYAWRTGRGRTVPPLIASLDTAGGWVALALSGASGVPIVVGGIAGALLPLALGPWPQRWQSTLRGVAVIGTGAVGLRGLIQALTGGAFMPLLLLSVPWLLIWDWRSVRADATIGLPRQ